MTEHDRTECHNESCQGGGTYQRDGLTFCALCYFVIDPNRASDVEFVQIGNREPVRPEDKTATIFLNGGVSFTVPAETISIREEDP